jgi:hypothetical protein
MQDKPVGWHLGKAKAISSVGNQEGTRPEIFSVVRASNSIFASRYFPSPEVLASLSQ